MIGDLEIRLFVIKGAMKLFVTLRTAKFGLKVSLTIVHQAQILSLLRLQALSTQIRKISQGTSPLAPLNRIPIITSIIITMQVLSKSGQHQGGPNCTILFQKILFHVGQIQNIYSISQQQLLFLEQAAKR